MSSKIRCRWTSVHQNLDPDEKPYEHLIVMTWQGKRVRVKQEHVEVIFNGQVVKNLIKEANTEPPRLVIVTNPTTGECYAYNDDTDVINITCLIPDDVLEELHV